MLRGTAGSSPRRGAGFAAVAVRAWPPRSCSGPPRARHPRTAVARLAGRPTPTGSAQIPSRPVQHTPAFPPPPPSLTASSPVPGTRAASEARTRSFFGSWAFCRASRTFVAARSGSGTSKRGGAAHPLSSARRWTAPSTPLLRGQPRRVAAEGATQRSHNRRATAGPETARVNPEQPRGCSQQSDAAAPTAAALVVATPVAPMRARQRAWRSVCACAEIGLG
jgi:hypothetical protein